MSTSIKEKKEISVTLNYNYGGDENKKEVISLSYQEPYELPLPEIPSFLGDAVFEGWYNSNKRVETKGDSFPFSSSLTLYAHYSHNDFDGIENSSNGITITSVKKKVGNIIIPQYYNGKRVTELASSLFMGSKKITNLLIPEGVEKIGEGCFLSCPNLREVHLPKSLKQVKSEAFSQCKKLKKVYYAGDLSSWLNIDFDYDSNPCSNLASLYFKDQLVTEITVPENIKRIKDYAFSGATSITSIVLTSVTSIGEEAFSSCRGLKTLSLPECLIEIGENAFSYCTLLPSLAIPSQVKVIPSNAFGCCFSLTNVILGEKVETIEDNAFLKCYDLTIVTFPSNLKIIGKSAFESCTHLTHLSFPSTLETIEACAFAKCQALTAIHLPSSVSVLGNGAFEGTYKVEARSVDKENQVYYSSSNTILEKGTKRVVAGCKNSI
ncbi:MAG: leucine-rich repeat domain-containing protein, partial [Candidatus Enterosoma sp.]|nr:leucine-rich repeat domain-containing protein [Candidatus Enterosoma sp.]